MSKADYQLRHQIFGRQGSLWERQTDAPTREILRGIVSQAGGSAELGRLDNVSAGLLGDDQIVTEDLFFEFVDGDFAVIGRRQDDYDHHAASSDDALEFQIGYRDTVGLSSDIALPTRIARLTTAFIREAQAAPLPLDRDWYLVPVPDGVTPIVIASKNEDEFLVSGVDFIPRAGCIAMTDNPADVLPSGLVRISAGYKRTHQTNAFVTASPSDHRGTKWVTRYTRSSQSLSAFRSAAAEYAGLYVIDTADIVTGVIAYGDSTIYILATAGVVTIDYPHAPLVHSQQLPAGYVICGDLHVTASTLGGPDLKPIIAEGWDGPLLLDGILPVNGLTWMPGEPVFADSVNVDPDTGKAHIRLHFEGADALLERYWEFQRLHELATGVFLVDEIGTASFPSVIDFWSLLDTYYGPQLVMVLAAAHNPRIDTRLRRFVEEQHPSSSAVIHGLLTVFPSEDVRVDAYGRPVLDETGNYVVLNSATSCIRKRLTLRGIALYFNGDPLTLNVCSGDPNGLLYDDEPLLYDGDNLSYTLPE